MPQSVRSDNFSQSVSTIQRSIDQTKAEKELLKIEENSNQAPSQDEEKAKHDE